jgi:quinoprotein glucose dehydrogenase
VYVLDWAETMSKTAKGRIFRVYDPAVLADPLTLETKKYLEEGMKQRDVADLTKLLAHADRRVRMEAEFELAARGKEGRAALVQAATKKDAVSDARLAQLARLHAIWGLGIQGRKETSACESLPALLKDTDSEVRAQVAKVLGDVRYKDAAGALIGVLKDETPRVRYFAAQALGKLKAKQAATDITEVLKQNADKDAYLRHACVMALYGMCVKSEGFQPSSKPLPDSALDEDMLAYVHDALYSDNESVALAVVLLARRLHQEYSHLLVGAIYNDNKDESLSAKVRAEAARAVTEDYASDRGMLYEQAGAGTYVPMNPITTTRTLYARFMEDEFELGPEHRNDQFMEFAEWLAGAAVSDDHQPNSQNPYYSLEDQLDALTYLGDWATPQTRNRFTGLTLTKPWIPRDAKPAVDVINQYWEGLISSKQNIQVRVAAIAAVRKLKAEGFAPKMAAIVKDQTQPAELRLAALETLGDWQNVAALNEAITEAQESGDAALRRATLKLLPKVDAERAVVVLEATLDGDDTAAKREAMVVLGTLPTGKADALIAAQVDKLIAGKVKPTGMLEVIETAKRREDGAVKAKLQQYLQTLPQTRNAAAFPYLLAGGDANAGKKIFFEHTAAQCMRCHKIGNKGSEVGPALDGVSTKHPREYLLEAVLFPNNNIAPGFEMTMITTKDGKTFGGMVRKDTDIEIQLSAPVPNAPVDTVKKADIQTRAPGISAMPEIMQQVLTQRELRDLVAYLASLK